ncbi:hypothetical protein CI1B_37410 [Bradyrhizobium ivorense]|uniref:Uncharacterized protein n=1 Tax=Bradyrhizobium ivorense TaxID=2511166 RepID=A0A508TEH5_9BRAD|nr:hypothetical protein CI1B_37410 [Bradyrhizobium ivorense]
MRPQSFLAIAVLIAMIGLGAFVAYEYVPH